MTLSAKRAVADVLAKFGTRRTRGSLTFGFMPTMSADYGWMMMKEVNKRKPEFESAMDKKEQEAKESYK